MSERQQPSGSASAGGASSVFVATLRQQAMAHYRAGNRAAALEACRQLLRLAPKLADVAAFAGTVAMELGAFDDAVTFYEQAVAAKRDFVEAHYNLGNALMQVGRTPAAVESYRRAAKLRPSFAPAHNNLGNALQTLERWTDAADAYRRATALAPNVPDVARNLGIVLEKLGDIAGAEAAHRRAIALKPGWSRAYSSLANLLMDHAKPRDVISLCDAWLAACPGTIEAIGLKSVALELIGEREVAHHLVDLDRFVRITHFTAPPEGYADMAAFNAALARHALTHPTLILPAEDDPRYHCPTLKITGEFLAEPKGPAAALEAMMRKAVSDYLAALAADPVPHPFTAKPPKQWRLTSWAAVLERQGNLDPHIHYDGFVSGVYYCQLPTAVSDASQGQAGWFELGRLPARFEAPVAPDVRAVRPEEGMMILFPSYIYHRTVPFETGETRISIAFDVMPMA
ncbi:MAG TPA: tetratricopeptide repeat protein [Stellaceae bacterium]|nr:tetratricopeptide repeat protein [Stellaceae bacterium]